MSISNDDGRLLLSSSYENGFRSKTIIYHKMVLRQERWVINLTSSKVKY